MKSLRGLGGVVVLLLLLPVSASASPAPLGLTKCSAAGQGLRQCSGLVPTWDGVPLDTTVTLPRGGGRKLPLVVLIHGFGNSKYEYLQKGDSAYTGNAYDFAEHGYAVLTYTARGLWGSCGTPEARLANVLACAAGYIRLADIRYEVRDTQELVGRLVDEGVARADAIGVTGDSYGGGQSLDLAALRNRVMLTNGRLAPWRSPDGAKLTITASAPVIPWSDLASAATPNGRTSIDDVMPRSSPGDPIGVAKASFVTAIAAATQIATGPGQPPNEPFVIGRPSGFVALPGRDPQTDILGWVARIQEGEPYDNASARAVYDSIQHYHSAYQVDSSRPPAPLFLASGFTDDLFPVDESLRFANRTQARYPKVPVSMLFGDFGHQRASNKTDVRKRLAASILRFFDDHLRGKGPGLARDVVAYTQTCPQKAPSGGPYRAPTFQLLARDGMLYRSSAMKTFNSLGGNLGVGTAIDPVTGGGNACARVSGADEPGSATYRLPAIQARRGVTMLGAPVVSARLRISGARPQDAQVASRLWDVAPDGQQTLVARGSLRPRGSGREQWELHANGWRFEQGHIPKLELLGSDLPYTRISNAVFNVQVSGLRLELPTRP